MPLHATSLRAPPTPAPSQAHWPKRAPAPVQSGEGWDVGAWAPFPPGPHKETTFPRLPCSWARPYDHILANGMWTQGCYNFTPGHENRPRDSLHHFSRPLNKMDSESLKKGRAARQKEPSIPERLGGAELCLSPAHIRPRRELDMWRLPVLAPSSPWPEGTLKSQGKSEFK